MPWAGDGRLGGKACHGYEGRETGLLGSVHQAAPDCLCPSLGLRWKASKDAHHMRGGRTLQGQCIEARAGHRAEVSRVLMAPDPYNSCQGPGSTGCRAAQGKPCTMCGTCKTSW